MRRIAELSPQPLEKSDFGRKKSTWISLRQLAFRCVAFWKALRKSWILFLHLPLDHHPLDVRDCLGGVEVFGAGLGAVHDGVAAVEPERVLEIVEPLALRLVARVDEPAIGLEEDRGPKVTVAVPPVTRAGGGAAGAQDAFVEPVELGAVFRRLQPLLLGGGRRGLEPGL